MSVCVCSEAQPAGVCERVLLLSLTMPSRVSTVKKNMLRGSYDPAAGGFSPTGAKGILHIRGSELPSRRGSSCVSPGGTLNVYGGSYAASDGAGNRTEAALCGHLPRAVRRAGVTYPLGCLTTRQAACDPRCDGGGWASRGGSRIADAGCWIARIVCHRMRWRLRWPGAGADANRSPAGRSARP